MTNTSTRIIYDDVYKWDTISNSYGNRTITSTNGSTTISGVYGPYYKRSDFYCDEISLNCKTILNSKTILNKRVISKKLVPETEERTEEYIKDNCDRYMIDEYGTSYIYQIIQEKAYEFASEIIEEAKEDYIINESEEDSFIDSIIEEVDFDSLYELVDDIWQAPVTMEEKLAEVGMSIRDFL
jgi:hypothetical protein